MIVNFVSFCSALALAVVITWVFFPRCDKPDLSVSLETYSDEDTINKHIPKNSFPANGITSILTSLNNKSDNLHENKIASWDTFSRPPLTPDDVNVSLPSIISTFDQVHSDPLITTPPNIQCILEDESSENIISDVESTNPYTVLSGLRVKYLNRIIFAHININSIRNKFDMLTDLIRGNIDILLISETKIDETFLSSQFSIPGFSTPYRMDRTVRGGRNYVIYQRRYPFEKNTF